MTASEHIKQHSIQDMTLREIARMKIHHGRRRFRNPWSSLGPGRYLDVLKWKLFSPNLFRQYYRNERVMPVDIDWRPVKEHSGLSVTFITHSTLLIKDRDLCIIIDPVLNGLPGPIRNFTPLNFPVTAMPRPDIILITHGHYDHLDTGTLNQLAGCARFVSPLGYSGLLSQTGARDIRELDWFDSVSDGAREIILLPCNHWTMRNPFTGPNTALWGSYIIKTSAGPVLYLSGDTAYFDRFSEIGQEFDIDLAVFNLGAYEPRWFMKQSHISPPETARACEELRAKRLMVVHWGTFRLGDEPVYFPPLMIREEMDRAGLGDRLVDIKHGQTLFFGDTPVVR